MKHVAWDRGAIFKSIDDVFGEGSSNLIPLKTSKTVCGKRVKFDLICNDFPTCDECLDILEKEVQDMGELFEFSKTIKH